MRKSDGNPFNTPDADTYSKYLQAVEEKEAARSEQTEEADELRDEIEDYRGTVGAIADKLRKNFFSTYPVRAGREEKIGEIAEFIVEKGATHPDDTATVMRNLLRQGSSVSGRYHELDKVYLLLQGGTLK